MSAWLEINSATVYQVIDSCTIGRAQGNRLVLHSPSVSRRHAMVYGSAERGYWVTDLGSRNGTFVNELPVKDPVLLADKDRILMGNYLLTFHRGKRPPTTSVETRPASNVSTSGADAPPANTSAEYGVLSLDSRCRIRRVTPNVTRWFGIYFARENFSESRMPPTLENWVLTRQRELQKGARGAAANEEFKAANGDLVLTARLADTGFEEIILVLSEEQPRLTASALVGLGLTPREAEVLVWVGQDKSNADIGGILGISPKTVEVHLYNVYQKLGVENRRQALSAALERLGPKPSGK
ncbi:MAG: LuxR C-terminal-related transcriptional regulator [Verrucomicrobiota bacterium]